MTNEEWLAKLEVIRAKLSSPKTVLVVERKLYQEGRDGCFSSSYLMPTERLALFVGATMSGHELRFEKFAGSHDCGLVGIGNNSEIDDGKKSIWLDTSGLAKDVNGDAVGMFLDPRSRPMWFTPDGRFPYNDPDVAEVVASFEGAQFPMLELVIGEEAIADWLALVQDERLAGVAGMFSELSMPLPRSEKLNKRLQFVIARLYRVLKVQSERVSEARLALDNATKHLLEKKKFDEEESSFALTSNTIGLLIGRNA